MTLHIWIHTSYISSHLPWNLSRVLKIPVLAFGIIIMAKKKQTRSLHTASDVMPQGESRVWEHFIPWVAFTSLKFFVVYLRKYVMFCHWVLAHDTPSTVIFLKFLVLIYLHWENLCFLGFMKVGFMCKIQIWIDSTLQSNQNPEEFIFKGESQICLPF